MNYELRKDEAGRYWVYLLGTRVHSGHTDASASPSHIAFWDELQAERAKNAELYKAFNDEVTKRQDIERQLAASIAHGQRQNEAIAAIEDAITEAVGDDWDDAPTEIRKMACRERALEAQVEDLLKDVAKTGEAYKQCAEDGAWACATCIAEMSDEGPVYTGQRMCSVHGRTAHWRLRMASVAPEAIGGHELGDHEREMGETK